MKTLFSLALALFAFIAMSFCVSSTNNDCLKYENTQLKIMVQNVVDYADSTADTGEFDEFILSKQGQEFFKKYNELYKGE